MILEIKQLHLLVVWNFHGLLLICIDHKIDNCEIDIYAISNIFSIVSFLLT
jgi:hypothetical protein